MKVSEPGAFKALAALRGTDRRRTSDMVCGSHLSMTRNQRSLLCRVPGAHRTGPGQAWSRLCPRPRRSHHAPFLLALAGREQVQGSGQGSRLSRSDYCSRIVVFTVLPECERSTERFPVPLKVFPLLTTDRAGFHRIDDHGNDGGHGLTILVRSAG